MSAVPSPIRTAVALLAVVAVSSVLIALGVPSVPVVLVGAGVGGGIVARDMSARRSAGATARRPDVAGYPLCLPCERVAVGAKFQFRLLPPTRAVWAPGMLCIDTGAAKFVPSAERHGSREWSGQVDQADVAALTGRSTSVRLRSASSAAQFVVQQPAEAVSASLGRFVRVA